ncbi:MAG: Fic family protein [Thermoguttaceae bacterium]
MWLRSMCVPIMERDAVQPYVPENLPPRRLDWTKFIRLIGQANAELARYDGILQGMVNPQVLLSPLTTQEAVLSSKIEGTQTSLEEVLEYDAVQEAAPDRQDDLREVLNYRRAMGEAVKYLERRPVCLDLLNKIHRTLMEDVRGQDRGRGRFRSIQNWIGRPGSTLETAKFVPPDPVTMNEALSHWERYIHRDEQDRLVQMAVIHAQFEIIHPFSDGNGRVGRMIIPLVLYSYQLLSSPMFYLSEYLEGNRETYYDRLHRVTDADEWDGWVQFFLTAIIEQARRNAGKAKAILRLYERMKTQLPGIVATQFSVQTIDTLFGHPVFKTSEFVSRSKIPKATGMRILRALQDNGVLQTLRSGGGRRPAILMFRELIVITEGKDL